MGLLIAIILVVLTAPFFIVRKIKTMVDFRNMVEPLEDIAVSYGYKRGIITSQIALETNYGKSIIDKNLFNIKATGSWLSSGKFVERKTWEIIKGVRVDVIAKFRKYDSYEESLKDYITLISSLSRYAYAWSQRDNEMEYFKGLVQGGYATDLVYAEKLEVMFGKIV